MLLSLHHASLFTPLRSYRLGLPLVVLAVIFSSCQSSGRLSMAEEEAKASLSCSSSLGVVSVAGDSSMSPGDVLPTVSAGSSGRSVVLESSSGVGVRFSRSSVGWQAALSSSTDAYLPCGPMPVVSSPGTDIGSMLAWLRDAGSEESRSRVHVVSSSASPTGVASVYLGRLGLLGGMHRQPVSPSSPSDPVWLSLSCKKQRHGVVTVGPGKQVRVPYVIPSGWSCVTHHVHIVQEVPNASHYVELLPANFSYSRSDLEGSNHHHALNQGLSGPNVSVPTFSVEVDLSIGRLAQKSQGSQQYTTHSAHTTHDVLVLVAGVPSEFRERSWRGYKTKPITTSLQVQLEVILERTSSPSTPLHEPLPFHPPTAPQGIAAPTAPVPNSVPASSTLASEHKKPAEVRKQVQLPEEAFGAKEWSQYFGEVGAAPPLPANIDEILSSRCPFWPGKQVKDTHLLVLVPATVDGRPFTLDLLGKLIQNPKGGGRKTEYRNYDGGTVQKELGAKSPGSSYWVLMTRDILPDSRSNTHDAQEALVAAHARRLRLPYEMPHALEAATAILLHHARTDERLYTDDPWTFTRCQKEVDNNRYPPVVGGFFSGGLGVFYDAFVYYDVGVSCLRKF
ncbi:MAG: hypothetical protein RL012_122 [Bacteroidota bacterium]